MDSDIVKEVAPLQLLTVLKYPHPMLKTQCNPVEDFGETLQELIRNMFVTMYADNGVGLSANQVGVPLRVFIMDTSVSGDKRQVYINPSLVSSSDPQLFKEGCLSFPGVFAQVKRFNNVTVTAFDEKGVQFTRDLQGIDALCFQHELDHLWGITFYDHLSQLKKSMIRKKMSKI